MCFNCPSFSPNIHDSFLWVLLLGCLYPNMLNDLISIQIAQLQRIIETRGSRNFSATQICKSLQPLDKNSTYHNLLSITVKPSLLYECSANFWAIRWISRSNVDHKPAFGNLYFTWNLNRKHKIKKS